MDLGSRLHIQKPLNSFRECMNVRGWPRRQCWQQFSTPVVLPLQGATAAMVQLTHRSFNLLHLLALVSARSTRCCISYSADGETSRWSPSTDHLVGRPRFSVLASASKFASFSRSTAAQASVRASSRLCFMVGGPGRRPWETMKAVSDHALGERRKSVAVPL